jgi:hypothetical protein
VSAVEQVSDDDFWVCIDSVFVTDFWFCSILFALKITASVVEPGSGDDF